MKKLERINKKTLDFTKLIGDSFIGEISDAPVAATPNNQASFEAIANKIELYKKHQNLSVANILISEKLSDEEVSVYITGLLSNNTSSLDAIRRSILEQWLLAYSEVGIKENPPKLSKSEELEYANKIAGVFDKFPEKRLALILNLKQFATVLEGNDNFEKLYEAYNLPSYKELIWETVGFITLLLVIFFVVTMINF